MSLLVPVMHILRLTRNTYDCRNPTSNPNSDPSPNPNPNLTLTLTLNLTLTRALTVGAGGGGDEQPDELPEVSIGAAGDAVFEEGDSSTPSLGGDAGTQ